MWTPELVTAIFAGTAVLVSSAFGFAYKIWKDHNRIIKDMSQNAITLVEKNIESSQEMKKAIYNLKDSTDKNTESTKVAAENTKTNTDTLNKLMLEIIRKS